MNTTMTVLTAVSVVGLLTVLLASLLIVASRKLYVQEDARLEKVEEMLPQNNCGGCGYPSCRMFAEALVAEDVLPGKCTVSSEQERTALATFLDVESGTQIKQVARLACAGGSNVAKNQAIYLGQKTCTDAAQVASGGKRCAWGCIGFGDCEAVCDFSAISMNQHGLPVVDEEKCTACGDCVEVCPKDLFSLQRIDHHLWVICKNQELGDHILDYCQVACTACGRCAADAAANQISMQNNLPVIQHFKNTISSTEIEDIRVIQRCPTGAIVWISDEGEVEKGKAAKVIIRQSPLRPIKS